MWCQQNEIKFLIRKEETNINMIYFYKYHIWFRCTYLLYNYNNDFISPNRIKNFEMKIYVKSPQKTTPMFIYIYTPSAYIDLKATHIYISNINDIEMNIGFYTILSILDLMWHFINLTVTTYDKYRITLSSITVVLRLPLFLVDWTKYRVPLTCQGNQCR